MIDFIDHVAQVIGGNSAYVGFGAGTGGETATQQILNWQGQLSPANATRLTVSAPSNVSASNTSIKASAAPYSRVCMSGS